MLHDTAEADGSGAREQNTVTAEDLAPSSLYCPLPVSTEPGHHGAGYSNRALTTPLAWLFKPRYEKLVTQ